MMDMRERIARAINPFAYYEGTDQCYRDDALRSADAVLEAMREPTEEMVQARIDCYPRELRIKPYDLEVWQTMIDAARTPLRTAPETASASPA